MSDSILRKKLIRLAHEKPELRSEILPLLRKEAMEFDSEAAKKKYLNTHKVKPGTKLVVKEKGDSGKKEAPKEKGDSGSGKKEAPKKDPKEKVKVKMPTKVLENMGQWHDSAGDVIYQVSSHASGGHPVSRELIQKAHDKIESMQNPAYGHSKSDLADLKKIQQALKKSL